MGQIKLKTQHIKADQIQKLRKIEKKERSQIHNLTLYLEEVVKEKQTDLQINRVTEIIRNGNK